MASLCVLLVDDHESSLSALSRLLQRNGHTIYTAATVHEARNLMTAKRCDLVIADLTLPDGSGLDLIREARGVHGIPAIALSGDNDERTRAACLHAGCSAWLLKPVTFPELEAAVLRATSQPTR